MPKNPHPPRGGSAKKSVAPAEDTSFIVFGDGKPKKGKKSENSAKASDVNNNSSSNTSNAKSKGKAAAGAATPGTAEDAPKRPDTRTLIAGASWTGKLPVNMCNEHFQKQHWQKPDYKMHKEGNSHVADSIVVSKTNSKTQETTTLPPFKVPPELSDEARHPTAIEARNFAATYMLYRVASGKNMHMMMPPNFRDLWKGKFSELKKQDERDGKAWMYEADPFFGHAEREKAKAIAAKEREKRQKEREQAAKSQNLQPGMALPGGGAASAGSRNILKGWERVPKVELGKKVRKEVERLIRRDAVWNPHAVSLDPQKRARLVEDVAGLGFRLSHVQEAAEICKDREEIIEWLLIHVPEDDLPPWSLPEGYVAGISMASSNLKREGAIKRLAAAGYPMELCEEAFDGQGSDEGRAAAYLQARVLRPTENEKDVARELADLSVAEGSANAEDEIDPWDEEQSSLQAIYGDLYEKPSPSLCRIQLDIKQAGKRLVLQVRRPPGPYPSVLPIITFEASIPSYIRLSIIRQALIHAETNLMGMPMIFDIVDWLQQNAGAIFKDPGRLSDISPGLAASDQNACEHIQRKSARGRFRKPISWDVGSPASQNILSDWQRKQNTPAQQRMMTARRSLPAWRLQDTIIRVVNSSQVTIISGETGSGKSTQSVQFILDDLIQNQLGAVANIICTQPRRISALGLADRVSDERCSQVGEEIGYTIRGESKSKPGITKITFVTTGVLLRRLQTSGGSSDDVVAALADVSHVVVDEVHERSLDTDFLLVLLRDILRKRKDLKVILMSATLDADVFEAYFRDVGPVGRVEIEGRTHPVEDFYMDDVVRFTGFGGQKMDEYEEDEKSFSANLRSIGFGINYDLIAETVHYIDSQLGTKDGGILIFMPGTMEIDRTLQALRQFPHFHALPLHASLIPADQKRVFPPAPAGKRKVIVATNVAETSITIEDIVAVIDTGRVKETSFDPQNNMVRLAETWASRAACKQRRGRAGRVRAGQCYKLYTRNAEFKMMERPDPEIRRVPLEQLCLSIKAMGVQDIPHFLASALTPPESTAVEGAISLLGQIGAIQDNELTALGRHLSMIPADLRCGKLLVYGATFGCLEAALTIASVLTARSPFLSPRDRNADTRAEFNRIRGSFCQNQGDLLVDLRAYEQWSALRSKGTTQRDLRFWCQNNALSSQTLFDIASNRTQYLSSLQEISLISTSYSSTNPTTHGAYNKHNGNDALIRSLIAGSFNPQIARIQLPTKKFAAGIAGAVELDPEARTIKYFNQENGRIFIHPSSTLFDSQTFPSNASFIAYFNKMATSKIFIRDITPFNAFALLMFAGEIKVDTLGRGLVVDEWIRLRGWARIGVLISRLRGMLDKVLERKVREPGWVVEDGGREDEVLRVVRWIVERDGLDN